MNPRITLGFVVVLALLAAAVVGLDRFNVGHPNGTPTPTASVDVMKFDDTKVTAVTLKSADKSVRFEKQGDNWTIAGSSDPANRISLTSLLIRMGSLTATSQVTDASDLASFGLDKPKDEITAELDDGTKPDLQLGNKTPVGTGVYAKKADAADVYVIATQFQTDLERLVSDPKQPPTPTPIASPSAVAPSVATPAVTPTP